MDNVDASLWLVRYETNPANHAQPVMETEMLHNAPFVDDINADGVLNLLLVSSEDSGVANSFVRSES